MPRYYFHSVNGHTEIDAEGVEFDSLQEARDNAVRFAGLVIAEECHATLWNGQPWSFQVTDAPHLRVSAAPRNALGAARVHALTFGWGTMRGAAASNDPGRPTGPPAFHAVVWIQRGHGRKIAIADLQQDCENFDDIVGSAAVIDGVKYICFAVHAFDLLPPYRKGQSIELVVTEF